VPLDGPIGRAVLSSVLSVLAVVGLVVGLLAIFGKAVGGGDDAAGAAAVSTPSATLTSAAPAPTPTSAKPRAPSSPQATSPVESAGPAAPATRSEPSESADSRDVPDIGVAVLNQSSRRGLATEVAGDLRAAGWRIVDVGNWQGSVPETTVYYPRGFSAAADALAADLAGVDRTRPRQSNMPMGVLTVILHDSYAG
jgi:hypothetical protein